MLMRLNIEGVARPVRTEERFSFATETAFSIFSSASRRVSSITTAPCSACSCLNPGPGEIPPGLEGRTATGGAHQGADLLTTDRSRDVPLGEEVEDEDRHVVVHAEAEGRGVGDVEAALQHLAVGDVVEHQRVRVDLGVGRVD